ncbi:MAG TPA: nuclear transport factor 2 family protein [Sphingomonadaceae bacterium]|nr:nuclear transport factor 2 family protein [Sphingomonadaceae bacterium]
MSDADRLAAIEAKLEALTHEVGRHDDVLAVRNLQFAYGYFMDKCLFDEIVDLFADDAELHFMGGVFHGKAGARRLYGGASGMNGPAHGMLFEHIIAQDIVHVAADRKTAEGRFRCFMQGGVHRSKTDAPPSIPPQFLEAGIYENSFVREDGVWKISRFRYRVVYQCRFEEGWANAPEEPLMVSEHRATWPDNPSGPDRIEPSPPRWPKAVVMPFHYTHPVTGKPIAVPEPR